MHKSIRLSVRFLNNIFLRFLCYSPVNLLIMMQDYDYATLHFEQTAMRDI